MKEDSAFPIPGMQQSSKEEVSTQSSSIPVHTQKILPGDADRPPSPLPVKVGADGVNMECTDDVYCEKDPSSPPMPTTGVLPSGRSTPIPSSSTSRVLRIPTPVVDSQLVHRSAQVREAKLTKIVCEDKSVLRPSRLTTLPPSGPRAVTPGKLTIKSVTIDNKYASSTDTSGKQSLILKAGVYEQPPNRGPPGVWCELCNRRLGELRKQGRWIMQQAASRGITPQKDPQLLVRIADQLHLPEVLRSNLRHDQCTTCRTLVAEIRREALAMVQSLDRGGATDTTSNMAATYQHPGHQRAPQSGIPMFMGSRSLSPMPRTTPHYSLAHHRLARQSIQRGQPSGASAVKAHADQKQQAWGNHRKHHNQMLVSSTMMSASLVHPNSPPPPLSMMDTRGDYPNGVVNGMLLNGSPLTPPRPLVLPVSSQHHSPGAGTPTGILSPGSTGSGGSGASAAASFFARAAQKLNISSRKKRKPPAQEAEPPPFPTNFNEIIHYSPPPAPPCLMRSVGRLQNPGSGKVKVMLRLCAVEGNQPGGFLSTDPRKKQVTVYDPSHSGFATSAHRRQGAPPKMFAFDAVFTPDDSLAEVCASSLTEIVQAVVNGADGCLFCYGHARLGKTYTMIGMDDSPQNLGVIPCAIAWLFKLINENKEKTGARFSVRVSAVEVTGKQEKLKDLLADVANAQEAGGSTAPGVYLREDPISGTQLENQSELRAPSAERAAYYLDAAIAARTVPELEEDARNSHLLFTLHVYQYRVEKGKTSGASLPQAVAGGRSRLHLIDLGSCSKSKDGNALSLSALGNVILALLNGQRHTPYRESKLTQLVRESLGNLSCRACMIAHVSPALQAYNETLQVIQLAARIHRMKRRKNKFSSTSSEESSCDESGRLRPRMRVGVRMGTLREDALYSSGLSHSDPEYSSSSEQSCDTVIYMGRNGQALSDRELTDNEGPPSVVPIMPRTTPNFRRRPSGSRSSGDESSHSESKLNTSQGDKQGITTMPKCGASFTNSRLASKPSSGRSTPTTGQSGSPSRSGSSQSGCASPSLGVVQLPRKINMKTKHGAHERTGWSKGPYREGGDKSEKWVDGPSAKTSSEQWVDGPDVYQPKINPVVPDQEQWIDGPSATNRSVPVNAPLGYIKPWMEAPTTYKDAHGHMQPMGKLPNINSSVNAGQNWVDGHSGQSPRRKPSANETWVDGPQEFRVEPCGPVQNPPKADRAGKMWTEMPKPTPPPRGVSLTTKSSSCPPSATSSPKASRPGHPIRNPVVAQVAADRPVSQVSIDSNTSLTVNPNSRPVSMHSNEASNSDPALHHPPGLETKQGSKSFVRDWVEKHSFTAVETASNPEYGLHHPHGHMTLNERVLHRDTSPKPGSSHSSPRIKKKLKRNALPPADSPRARTLAWVQSVQDADTEIPPGAGQEDLSMAPECDQDMLSDSHAPPPYDSCLDDPTLEDVDAQAERLAREEAQKMTNKKEKCTLEDLYHRSSPSSLRKDGVDLDLSRDSTEMDEGVPSTRESIYELEMDEQLEAMKAGSTGKNTFASEDDEVSSTSSCPQKLHHQSLEDKEYKVEEEEREEEIIKQTDELLLAQVMTTLNIEPQVEEHIQCPVGENLSPPSSEDSEKHTGKKLMRPTCLRRPDGASNPNLSIDPESKPAMDMPESDISLSSPKAEPTPVYLVTNETVNVKALVQDEEGPLKRSVIGQSPEDNSPTKVGCTPSKLPVKPSSKSSSSPSKCSILPKAFCRKSKSDSPCRSASKPNSRVSSPKNVPVGSRSANTSPTKSVNSSNKASKEKSNRQKSTSPSPGSRASSVKSLPARFASGPSTPVRMSSCPPTPSKIPSGRFKGFCSPSRSSSSNGKESKSSKESKSKSKSPSQNKKESKLPTFKMGNSRVSELTNRNSRVTDSDSGNDSGIVKNDKKCKKLLSPYSLVTKPRAPSHSSSGHGSDNSSTFSHIHTSSSHGVKTPKTEASSGYESMIRDSEASGTSSSTQDSTSESSVGGRLRGNKMVKKKPGSRRSRSAPARTCSDSPTTTSRPQSPSTPVHNSSKPGSPSPRAWVDTRHFLSSNEDPLEIKMYDMDDVERLQRRRKEEAEMRALEKRRIRVKELLIKQDSLKSQLAEAKDMLMIDRTTWSYDLYVAEQMDRDDPHYLEALEKETSILEKRVEACKSRIMMVTCFDV